MFLEENYTGAYDILSEFLNQSKDADLIEQAEYFMAASTYYRNTPNSGNILKEFLEKYPETAYNHHIKFMIGSFHFDEKDWSKTLFWLDQANLDYLSPTEQEDYSFRSAYANLQEGNKDEATRLFGLLAQNSSKYGDAGDFYYGYIDYTKGNYDSALTRFQRLRNNPEFAQEVAFYTAQSAFSKVTLKKQSVFQMHLLITTRKANI